MLIIEGGGEGQGLGFSYSTKGEERGSTIRLSDGEVLVETQAQLGVSLQITGHLNEAIHFCTQDASLNVVEKKLYIKKIARKIQCKKGHLWTEKDGQSFDQIHIDFVLALAFILGVQGYGFVLCIGRLHIRCHHILQLKR